MSGHILSNFVQGTPAMPQITISKLAVEKITKDPTFRQLREGAPMGAVPILFYYQRSYSTLKDGSIIEHGDGFGLNFVDPKDLKEQKTLLMNQYRSAMAPASL
jgi:hypothetical protein